MIHLFMSRPVFRTRQQQTNRLKARKHRPSLELLEERCAPAVFNVNSLADILSPSTGTVTLRSAIQAANATPGGNTINLTIAGTYQITLAGTVGETDNAAGEFAILPAGGNLTVQNTSGSTVIVDGGELNNRVFDINPADVAVNIIVTMRGFTIRNGLATNSSAAAGGGIRDQGNANLTLNNMVIEDNFATGDGGGIAMVNSSSTFWTLTLNKTTVSDNQAGAGGGIETDGKGTVSIGPGCVISSNTVLSQGGGIYLDGIANVVSSVTITNAGSGYTTTPDSYFQRTSERNDRHGRGRPQCGRQRYCRDHHQRRQRLFGWGSDRHLQPAAQRNDGHGNSEPGDKRERQLDRERSARYCQFGDWKRQRAWWRNQQCRQRHGHHHQQHNCEQHCRHDRRRLLRRE
jgi:CSLREA domain-containing protein